MESYIDEKALSALLGNPDYSKRACEYVASVFEYAECVIGYRAKIDSARTLRDPGDPGAMQSEIESIDTERTHKHNRAISSLAILNRMADKAGLPPVYCGDIEADSRKDVAHAIFQFSKVLLDADDKNNGW